MFCCEALGEGDIQLLSATVQCVLSPQRCYMLRLWREHVTIKYVTFMLSSISFFLKSDLNRMSDGLADKESVHSTNFIWNVNKGVDFQMHDRSCTFSSDNHP